MYYVGLGMMCLLVVAVDSNKIPGRPGSSGFGMRRDHRRRLLKTVNDKTSKSGPVQIRIVYKTFARDYLKLKCTANVSYRVSFTWKLNNSTLNNGSRIKIESSPRESLITIRKSERSDSGYYTCVAKFNRTRRTPIILIEVRPRGTVKLIPKHEIVERGQTLLLHCRNLDENATSVNYRWNRKEIPGGKWTRVGNNSERYVWNTAQLSPPQKKLSFGVYDIICDVQYGPVWVRGPIGRFTVVEPGQRNSLGSCPAEVVDGIQWKKTTAGMIDEQPCFNDTGKAERFCVPFPGKTPWWNQPKLRACRNPQFKFLEDELKALEEGFNVDLDLPKILHALRGLTSRQGQPKTPFKRPRRIYGDDLIAAVRMLRSIRKDAKSRGVAKEIFRSFTETASNLLDLQNKDTWEDIDKDNPETPAELLSTLDQFGFDLEEELNRDNDDLQEATEKNLAFQVRRLHAKSELRKSGLTIQQNKSLIRLPPSVLNEKSSEATTVVTVVYDTLSSILPRFNVSQRLYNESGAGNSSSGPTLLGGSKIISCSIKPLGTETFKQPVKIVLENNGSLFNRTMKKRCVFWEPEEQDSQWSDEGCRVVAEETNEFVTTCECDHLTLFAVMVEDNEGSISSSDLSRLEVISTVGSAISLAAVLLTVAVYLYLWKSLKSPRCVNLINLCLALALLDIFSVMRGPVKNNENVCTTVGILLHYFLLALFLWMLCEGILLCLLLAEVFKKNYGRKWYIFVHALGWGFPALIVAISLGIAGPSEYGTAGNCWLSRENGFLWAALAPMMVVLLLNYVVYGVMIYRVLTSHKVQQKDAAGKLKAYFRASIIILPILGFAWIFAIFDFFLDELVFKYLFAIFNSLQGLFIFLFHCVTNQQVQQAMFKPKPRQKGILDRVKTQEMRMTGSQDSLETLN